MTEDLQFSTETAAASEQTLAVPSLTLADMFRRLELERCNLLKSVERIVMECHGGVTPYGHSDLVDFLRTGGFQVRTCPNPVHDHLGFLYAFQPQLAD